MQWELAWNDPFTQYLEPFESLVGDRRTWVTLTETVRGIIGSGSLVCQQIAAHAPVLASVTKGAQRVIRMATKQSTKRSPHLDAEHLTAQLRTTAIQQLRAAAPDELWLIADGSDLRKPHAKAMPDLMQVRALDKRLVPGYRTLNVIGMTPQWRGILYHRLFSSTEIGFVSEPREVQQALQTVSAALTDPIKHIPITWILDSGFDDVAVWRTVWEQQQHVVCRLHHTDRDVEYADAAGQWHHGTIADARSAGVSLATVETELEVRKPGQAYAKRQPVTAQIQACPIRLTYDSNVRRPGASVRETREVWLVEVQLAGTSMEPWLLLTDWPVWDAAAAQRIFQMYRQRWGVEDSFKFTKECLGWEDVQLLDLEGIRTLVALAWVAAGFLYQLGITLDDGIVQALARLGGWEPRPNRPPGKITLTRGLRRVIDMLTTNAWLQAYYRANGPFPPQLAAFLPGWRPDLEL
jgi:Transposase DDE domain